jgi:hypothetical protein
VNGAPDFAYVLARRVLLDALTALSRHSDAVILVGAQAIYLHTGPFEYPVAELTTDADITLHPAMLQPSPELAMLMRNAKFHLSREPGTWLK